MFSSELSLMLRQTQGVSHLERGQNFVAMMETINNGSLPDATTVDYIPGVSHDPWGMIIADAGLEKVRTTV